MTAVLEMTGIEGGYTATPAIRDISMVVNQHEIVGVLGANGAGKTSLLRALSGSLPTCRGDISLNGRLVSDLSPSSRVRAGIAHVPEGRHVFSAMTVRENLDVARLVRRPPVSRDLVFDLFPRLYERQTQLGGSLSGGEQQMLAIGRALMTSPALLAIDEMSAGLAPVLAEQLVEALARLRHESIAVVLVEQSPNLIADIVDRVYLLEHGRIVGEGTLPELGGVDRLAELYLGIG